MNDQQINTIEKINESLMNQNNILEKKLKNRKKDNFKEITKLPEISNKYIFEKIESNKIIDDLTQIEIEKFTNEKINEKNNIYFTKITETLNNQENSLNERLKNRKNNIKKENSSVSTDTSEIDIDFNDLKKDDNTIQSKLNEKKIII